MGKHFSENDLIVAERTVNSDPKYGMEQDIIEQVIKTYPQNDDLYRIAMKVSVIDLTNSTQLTNYKSKLSLYDIAKIILDLNIDDKIQKGDNSVVTEIAKACKNFNGKGVNLFSFASKYCCYHNVFAYDRDDFSIFDNVVSLHLYEYSTLQNPLGKTTPEGWRVKIDYQSYNNYIAQLLNEKEIHIQGRRRMFDHFVWNTYRPSNRQNTL